MREEQREATREQIVSAALMAISEAGFDGVSTRTIANRAKVSQGLLTYHFKSKEALWRAAADYLFEMLNDSLKDALSAFESAESIDLPELRRELIRQHVYFSAEHPEFLRFMIEQGDKDDERSHWLGETHLRPLFRLFAEVMEDITKADLPHVFYVIAGASSLIFCSPNECERITGVDPATKSAIKRHADYVANMIVPSGTPAE